jgi:polar amino acid transport system substrate-binding protein
MNAQDLQDRTIFIILIAFIIMTICAILIVGFFLVFEEGFPWGQAVTPEAPDRIWLKIQNEGLMVVGISADYPPFSFVGADFTMQGYDLALIQEIAKRLNLPLELHNMAFDGLVNALVLEQIDVAVAALSVTAERDAIIDFSNVYYVGEDAILARQDSQIQIATANDLGNYHIGVQKGSVYENWIRNQLIGPGLMQPQSLYTFLTVDEALQALVGSDPVIALFMLDFQPAEVATQTQGVKIIARGLNPQLYAIGIPQAAYTLQSQINQVLTEMQNDGTLAALANQYLNVSNPAPLPTPAPTQPPATPAACLDGMKFVQDLTLPDSNMTQPSAVQPGAPIQKGWRILNTGTCIWDSTYVLAYVGGAPANAPIGGAPVAIQGQVSSGQTFDIFADLVAPLQPGRYQSFWNLRNQQGAYFGDRLWAGFEVIGAAPPTPGPQAPTIFSFTADRFQIVEGQCVNIGWQYGGSTVYYSRIFRNGVLLLFDIPASGSAPDCPPGTGQVEYRLVLDSLASGSTAASQLVNIFPITQPTAPPPPTPEQPPVIFFFTVDATEIAIGQCINLTWSFGGSNLVSTQLFRNGEVIASNLAASGSQQDCPPQPGQIIYTLQVDTDFAGSAQESEFVRVLESEPRSQVDLIGISLR